MKRIILPVLLLSSATLLSATTNKEIKLEAKNAIMKMGGTLKSHMKQNMKNGGPLQAAKFCSQEASNLVDEVNKSYKDGTTVRRISLKYRNLANKPSLDEEKVLQSIQNDVDANKIVPKMIVKKVGANKYKVYKPLFIKKGVCLSCHGTVDMRDAEAYKLIKSKYPNDKAVGYKKGDFRGAFVVEIVK